MSITQRLEETRAELNAMADRCRGMAQELEELADRLPRPACAGTQNVTMVRGKDFEKAVESALLAIQMRRKESKHE